MSLRAALEYGKSYLAAHGVADAETDAWLLLQYVTGISRARYLAERETELTPEDWGRYQTLIGRRGTRIPLQYLTGEQEFMGLPFLVSGHVLIPRQDTETLAEAALELLLPGMHVLDLCTGSGCIAVSLAKLGGRKPHAPDLGADSGRFVSGPHAPGLDADFGCFVSGSHAPELGADADRFVSGLQASADGQDFRPPGGQISARQDGCAQAVAVDGADISPEALAVARENGRRLGVQVRWMESDLFAAVEGRYDMIVSNPPYIRTDVIATLADEVRLHEPRLALDGGADGLRFYREIVRESGRHLRPGGWLLLEIGCDQGAAVERLLAEAGFAETAVRRDLSGLDRVALGRYGKG